MKQTERQTTAPTHALVMDTINVPFSVFEGSEPDCKKEHKKWMTKIRRNNWITIPGPYPSELNVVHIVALRVVAMPPLMQRAKELEQDPRNATFIERAGQMADTAAKSMSDNQDLGYK